jgi:5'-nucleotidase
LPVRILLTNDDGVTSRGLLAAKQALDRVGTVSVIAPDSNRSGVGRGITIDRPLTVVEQRLRDGSPAYATDGTPVDCVRFAALGLLGEPPDLIVAGINYGVNLGDDVTYSGTVAAAFEGIVLGIPAVAVSQQSPEAGLHFRRQSGYDFSPAAEFLPRLVELIGERGLPPRTILNVNAPRPSPACRSSASAGASTRTGSTSSRTSRGGAGTTSTATIPPTTTSPTPTSTPSPRAGSRSPRSTST